MNYEDLFMFCLENNVHNLEQYLKVSGITVDIFNQATTMQERIETVKLIGEVSQTLKDQEQLDINDMFFSLSDDWREVKRVDNIIYYVSPEGFVLSEDNSTTPQKVSQVFTVEKEGKPYCTQLEEYLKLLVFNTFNDTKEKYIRCVDFDENKVFLSNLMVVENDVKTKPPKYTFVNLRRGIVKSLYATEDLGVKLTKCPVSLKRKAFKLVQEVRQSPTMHTTPKVIGRYGECVVIGTSYTKSNKALFEDFQPEDVSTLTKLTYQLEDEEGNIYFTQNLPKFCKEHGLLVDVLKIEYSRTCAKGDYLKIFSSALTRVVNANIAATDITEFHRGFRILNVRLTGESFSLDYGMESITGLYVNHEASCFEELGFHNEKQTYLKTWWAVACIFPNLCDVGLEVYTDYFFNHKVFPSQKMLPRKIKGQITRRRNTFKYLRNDKAAY